MSNSQRSGLFATCNKCEIFCVSSELVVIVGLFKKHCQTLWQRWLFQNKGTVMQNVLMILSTCFALLVSLPCNSILFKCVPLAPISHRHHLLTVCRLCVQKHTHDRLAQFLSSTLGWSRSFKLCLYTVLYLFRAEAHRQREYYFLFFIFSLRRFFACSKFRFYSFFFSFFFSNFANQDSCRLTQHGCKLFASL